MNSMLLIKRTSNKFNTIYESYYEGINYKTSNIPTEISQPYPQI